MKRKAYLAALATFSAAAVVGTAIAAQSSGNDALTISNAGISLVQAVSAAEQHVGGKASRAEYEQHKGPGVFDVEVVKGATVMDVKVDAENGKVIEATADAADHDDGGDHED